MNRNSKFKIKNSILFNKGFTLVELMIVVSILGILAAIVMPEFQGHIQQAKESAAKDNLRLFREAIQRYAADHNGTPPGYPNNDTSASVNTALLYAQLTTMVSNASGAVAAPGTTGYPYGPYLSEWPKNPINDMETISVVSSLPETGSDYFGWYYVPTEKNVFLNAAGADSDGVQYIDY